MIKEATMNTHHQGRAHVTRRSSMSGGTLRERGQILVMVVGGFIGLLAIVALALEGGTMILTRRDGQNASDLAAIAGTRIVSLNYTDGGRTQGDVYDAIETSMELNNCGATASAPCVWVANFVGTNLSSLGPVNDSSAALPYSGSVKTAGVRVGVTKSPAAIVGRILDFDSWNVSTEATALTGSSGSVPGGVLLPIALCGYGSSLEAECEQADGSNAKPFVAGDEYTLTEGKVGPGNFIWISWSGHDSATTLEDSICGPNNPPFSLDALLDSPGDWEKDGILGTNPADGETWFPGANGGMSKKQVRDCLQNYIDQGTTVLIPIYDVTSLDIAGGGHGANDLAYHIVGIAAFVLTDMPGQAKSIEGQFIEYYPLTDIPAGGSWQTPSAGDATTFIGLVK